MERIQHAIAKARAEREAEVGAAADVLRLAQEEDANGRSHLASGASPLAAPEASTKAPEPARSDADAAQAWSELAPLHLDRKAIRRNHLVAVTGRPGAAEVDAIRTRLLQQLKLKGFRSVAITSPSPGCGKSTVAMNLAFSLGRQPDQRTILADLDFRHPRLAQALGISERHSFASVLNGTSPFANQALRHGDNLALATTHAAVPNPAELLQSRSASEALVKLRDEYAPTVMLFDVPPYNVHDDAMAFLSQVDCALIIAAAEKTTIKQIDRCEREVASQTSVLGVILNRCRYMSSTESHSARYG